MQSNRYDWETSALRAELELFAGAAPSSRAWSKEGVLASVVPATPDRSVFNAVVPSSLDALGTVYDELFAVYRDAGVRAFTVWTEPGDEACGAFLASRGHALDASPRAMSARLAELELGEDDLEPILTDELGELAALCDRSFALAPPAFAAAMVRQPEPPAWRVFLVKRGELPLAGLMTSITATGVCAVSCVATAPEARGQGLASRLLKVALRDARERGAASTALEATSKGRGVYERLGYHDLGPMGMWEHRVPKPDR